ncbi:MAG: hypothetical protein CMK09_16700 [Ponticaulis sp.]|nr:hypothetical protein [Ponticaulis sp.]
MSYEVSEITAALKLEREARGFTQRELSERSGVPQAQISKLENGQADIRISTLVSLSRALGLEIELVPRKHVPAVQAITRSNRPAAGQRRYSRKSEELAAAVQASQFAHTTSAAEAAIDSRSELARSALEAAAGAASISALETSALEAAAGAASISALEYVPTKPAYALTDDDDE